MYKNKSWYENLQHASFVSEGRYNIPKIAGSNRISINELVGFNYAKSAKDTAEKGLHFFLDDYQFLRLWNNPAAYLNTLKKFDFVLSPDFSLYTDFPAAIQIFNSDFRRNGKGCIQLQKAGEIGSEPCQYCYAVQGKQLIQKSCQ